MGWVEALIRKISCFPGWLVLVLVGVQCQSLAKGLPTTVYWNQYPIKIYSCRQIDIWTNKWNFAYLELLFEPKTLIFSVEISSSRIWNRPNNNLFFSAGRDPVPNSMTLQRPHPDSNSFLKGKKVNKYRMRYITFTPLQKWKWAWMCAEAVLLCGAKLCRIPRYRY